MSLPPERARIVIIGGGIMGASAAFHLAERGETDVLLLERDRFTSGTTWHAAGLVAQLRASENLTRLSRYSLDLYAGLEARTGHATGFRQPGAISVATTPGRFEELRRTAAMATSLGVEAHVLSASEVRALWPLAETRDLVGAIHLPRDGMVSPVDTTMALLAGARQAGVRILEHRPVEGLRLHRGRVAGVVTREGEIEAEVVVLSAGMWSRDFAARYGVSVPLHAAEHYYVITEPLPELSPDAPVLRDPDHSAYFKEDARRLLVGLFEPVARPWKAERADSTSFIEIEPNLDHLTPLLERAYERLPILHETQLRQIFCGPESFTPDDRFILGEAPDLPGLFVAAGFNSIGVQAAGGVGQVLAEWILEGDAPMDLWDVDIRRFESFHSGREFLRDRTVESLGLLYAMHWPHRQFETARGVRHSPLHDRQQGLGADFEEISGWERASVYAPRASDPGNEDRWRRANWFETSAEEHRATREGVGLYDQSSYAKFIFEGPDALCVLQRISAAEMDVPEGKVVYTPWLNAAGGIEADLTVTRLGAERFFIVTSPASRKRDFHTLHTASNGERALLRDVTSGWVTLSLMGPGSRHLLSQLSPADFSNDAFPFATAQEIELGYARVQAMRITYVGELGWELYVPTEFALHVFEELTREGETMGLRHCGFHALRSCRLEKGYRHWGHDIGPEDTPLEAGLGFTVGWHKAVDFRGRAALEAQRNRGLERRLIQFAVEDEAAMLHHDEPVFRGGEFMGLMTSGGWGHTLGAALGMAYARAECGSIDAQWVGDGDWRVEIAGRSFPTRASLRPFYDPAGLRVREG